MWDPFKIFPFSHLLPAIIWWGWASIKVSTMFGYLWYHLEPLNLWKEQILNRKGTQSSARGVPMTEFEKRYCLWLSFTHTYLHTVIMYTPFMYTYVHTNTHIMNNNLTPQHLWSLQTLLSLVCMDHTLSCHPLIPYNSEPSIWHLR